MANIRKSFSFLIRNYKTNYNINYKQQCLFNISNYRFYSTNTHLEYNDERDPAPLFFNKDIQKLLKKITRVNMDKVFRHKKLETRQLETPTYKFMTDDELKQAFEDAAERANKILQMPPVVKIRKSSETVLSRDPALQGYDTSKYVFTDITFGIQEKDRIIVIRDVDGNLIQADWTTRQRMNQLYFPRPGRQIKTPLMFSGTYLTSLFERKEYEFVLDRACIQFEPDDPEYQRVVTSTYLHINEYNDFELLRSTRHFGPLTFFLVWFKMIDNLLLELISTSHINDANSLLTLYNVIHNNAIGSIELKSENDTGLIEKYITDLSTIKGQLELALQSYKEMENQQKLNVYNE